MSSFHFLPSTSSSSSKTQHVVVNGSLCHQVPALLGLDPSVAKSHADHYPPHQHYYHSGEELADQAAGKSSGSSRSSSSSGTPSSNGFYKRLVEWLSRKKKSHRRYSEVVLPADPHCPVDPHCRQTLHGLMAPSSAGRNQSAPMIFDVTRPMRSSSNAAAGRLSRLETGSGVAGEMGRKSLAPSSTSMSTSSTSSMMLTSSCSPLQPPQIVVVHSEVNGSSRLGVHAEAELEAPPTPTSSYSQSGIIQFEKQDSEDRGQEIDAEWIIPWSDIQVGQVISKRRSCTINR